MISLWAAMESPACQRLTAGMAGRDHAQSLVGGHGVGPCTSFLSGKRSTDELAARIYHIPITTFYYTDFHYISE
jgi:hypothetical protein